MRGMTTDRKCIAIRIANADYRKGLAVQRMPSNNTIPEAARLGIELDRKVSPSGEMTLSPGTKSPLEIRSHAARAEWVNLSTQTQA